MYKELNGATPSRERITDLSNELNLKENQIYKWFWDTKKKVEEDTHIAKQMSMGSRRDLYRQDSAGFLKKPKKECIGVDGKDGLGEQMTPQQIKTALKIH